MFDLKAVGYRDPLLVSGTDGVGTKLRVAVEAGVHDLVGMFLVLCVCLGVSLMSVVVQVSIWLRCP